MKFSKLLVLSALWLTAGSAMATVVERQAPAPKATAFAEAFTVENPGSADNYYYLYNLTAARFFTQGNTWGTRACVGPYASAVKVYFTPNEAGDGSYSISDYVCIRSTSYSWKGASAEAGTTGVYTDQSTGWGRPYWNVIAGDNNSFRLQNIAPLGEVAGFLGRDDAVAQDYGNAYSGFTDDNQRYPISEGLTQGVGHHIDWILVAEADYVGFASVAEAFNYEVYFKSQELLVAIEEGRAKNVDVTDEEAVYSNEASTIEQMDAAIAAIKDKIIKAAEQTATPDNPSDMTSAITNASYEGGSKGWSGTTPAIGYTAGEFYEKNYNMYQDIMGIPNGVYAVKVKGYFRPGSTQQAYEKWATGKDLNAYLYAKAGEDSVAVALVNIFEGSTDQKLGVGTEYGPDGSANDGQSNYVPNNMQAGEAYFEAGRYQNIVFNAVDDGKLRIGLMKDDSNFSMNWTMFDQWELSYLGNSAAAYTYWINEMKKALPDYSEMGETLYTADYLTAYNAAVAAAAATNKAEAVAALKAINDADTALQNNIALWKELQSVIVDATAVVADDALDYNYTGELGEWLEYDSPEILEACALTNAELEALIAEKKHEISEARAHRLKTGDVTKDFLTNADFNTDNWTGWTVEAAAGGNVRVGSKCAEAWNNSAFDIYQVNDNVPAGYYEISVQGFYRYGRGTTAWNAWLKQDVDYVKSSPVFIYLNAKTTPFMNVFGEAIVDNSIFGTHTDFNTFQDDAQNTFYAPNDMATAADAFASASEVNVGDNMFTQKAFGLVTEGEGLRIGVKGSSNQLGDSWVIFDNFKLTYYGFDPEIIKPILEEQINSIEAVLQNAAIGKTTYENSAAVLATAKEAWAGTNGKDMFNSLNALVNLENEINTSVDAMMPLATANANLAEEIEIATEAGRTSALRDASTLNEQITTGITNHTITEDAVNTLITFINSMIIRLRMPDQDKIDNASDANPVDMTSLIQNSTYDEGVSGWSGTEAAWGGENGALAELFGKNFNYYQEFLILPAGTYELGVQAFYRSGSAVNDYDKLDSIHTSHAFLYAAAINGTDSVMNAKAIQRLASITKNETYIAEGFVQSIEESMDGYAVAYTDTVDKGTATESYLRTFVPNTMGTANDQFMNGHFADNKVIVKLAEGETLRIGLLKTTLVENDWTIFDNWTLTYFGNNSGKEATGDNVTAIRTLDGQGETVKVEFFTLDGRKAGAAQKGLIIMKQTLDNGSIIVKKIRK